MPIVVEPGSEPFSLEDATVTTFAQAAGGPVINGLTAILDADEGLVKVTYPPGSFSPGNYLLHVEVAKGGEVQTVLATRVKVRPSPSN